MNATRYFVIRVSLCSESNSRPGLIIQKDMGMEVFTTTAVRRLLLSHPGIRAGATLTAKLGGERWRPFLSRDISPILRMPCIEVLEVRQAYGINDPMICYPQTWADPASTLENGLVRHAKTRGESGCQWCDLEVVRVLTAEEIRALAQGKAVAKAPKLVETTV